MLEEQVGGERDAIAHAAAEEVRDRPLRGSTDDVEAGDLDRAEERRAGQRAALPGEALRRLSVRALDVGPQARELPWIAADDVRLGALERAKRRITTVGLGEAGDPVVRDDLDDRSQRERRVQSERTA